MRIRAVLLFILLSLLVSMFVFDIFPFIFFGAVLCAQTYMFLLSCRYF